MNCLRAFKHTDIQALPTEVPFQAHFGNLHLSGTTCIQLWPSWPGSVQSRVEPTAQFFEEAVSELPPPPQTAPLLLAPLGVWVFVQQPHLAPLRPNCLLSSPPFGPLGKVFPVQAPGRSLLACG